MGSAGQEHKRKQDLPRLGPAPQPRVIPAGRGGAAEVPGWGRQDSEVCVGKGGGRQLGTAVTQWGRCW